VQLCRVRLVCLSEPTIVGIEAMWSDLSMARVNPIEVQKHLKGIDYPVSKEDLVKHAQEHGADEELQSILEELPRDEFQTPADVNKAIGQVE
jgi:hypothetical protein